MPAWPACHLLLQLAFRVIAYINLLFHNVLTHVWKIRRNSFRSYHKEGVHDVSVLDP